MTPRPRPAGALRILTRDEQLRHQALAMTEDQLQEALREAARGLDLFYWHDHDSRRNYAGLPDTLLVGPYGTIWAELKREKGSGLRPKQADVMARLETAAGGACEACGGPRTRVVLWRPMQWVDGTISRDLAVLRFGDRALHLRGGAR